jgi:Uma2 family endonuclease
MFAKGQTRTLDHSGVLEPSGNCCKVQEYFTAGVRQVWLVSWQQRTVTIYDSPTHVTILTEEDTLTSEALLPGFSCSVSEIFQRLARS